MSHDAAEKLRIENPERVALDVEGDSFYRYGERLCLVQAEFHGAIFVLDPLETELAPFLSGIENRELIFHGADFDLRLLHARYGFRPARVFDTMLAARFLNFSKFGLSDLYQRYFGVILEKKHQRADWCHRPLSGELLDYARKDVEHLDELARRLAEELDAAGRTEWHREECALVVSRTIESARRAPDPDAWRVKGAGPLARKELAYLRELALARDEVAREMDRALFRVFSAEELIRLARSAAEDPEGSLRAFSRPLPAKLLRAFRGAIERARSLAPEDWPPRPAPGDRPEPALEKRVRKLAEIRDRTARALDLDAGFLLARTAIVRIAQRNPHTREELSAVLESRWRANAIGEAFTST